MGNAQFESRVSATAWLFVSVAIGLTSLVLQACTDPSAHAPDGKTVVVVFKHGKLFGDPESLQSLIRVFEQNNPDIRIVDEVLPPGTDEQHQFYVINLRAKSRDFDVYALDVIWAQEFARAGWMQSLDHLMPQSEQDRFFRAPIDAVSFEGTIYAIPWYADAGILYYRRDLLQRYDFKAPKQWGELVRIARHISAAEGIYGFVWQGKQYEGLVCNVLEYLWSNGGDVLADGRVVINSRQNRAALAFVRRLIDSFQVTPALVTTAAEESSRRIFGDGKAVFLRNWPYAWNLFQRDGSPVQGKVAISMLPSFPGHRSAATLGGWQLAVNPYSRNKAAAERFLRFITSRPAQKELALRYGFQPARRSLYFDRELLEHQPFLSRLRDIFEQARPRPLTPRYAEVSQVLQGEFSAAVAGAKTPEESLAAAERQLRRVFVDDPFQ